MKLYITLYSPYARLVRIMLAEKGLGTAVETIIARTREIGSPYYKINPYSFHASIEYMNKEMAEWAKKYNMKLYYYTINNTQSLKKAKALYADGIFSDYPNILD